MSLTPPRPSDLTRYCLIVASLSRFRLTPPTSLSAQRRSSTPAPCAVGSADLPSDQGWAGARRCPLSLGISTLRALLHRWQLLIYIKRLTPVKERRTQAYIKVSGLTIRASYSASGCQLLSTWQPVPSGLKRECLALPLKCCPFFRISGPLWDIKWDGGLVAPSTESGSALL